MSPVPGPTRHATKCLSRSTSIALVCLPRASGIVLAVCVCACVFMFPCTEIPHQSSLGSSCSCRLIALVTLSRFFSAVTNGNQAAVTQPPPALTELPRAPALVAEPIPCLIPMARLWLPGRSGTENSGFSCWACLMLQRRWRRD